jgi:hypothetical protein
MQARAQNIDGNLTLVIPLGAGGDELLEPSRGIGKVDGKDLKIVIPYWLADKLGLDDGSQGILLSFIPTQEVLPLCTPRQWHSFRSPL